MNKTRRRKKTAAPAKPAKAVVTKVTSPSKIRHAKDQIAKHCENATHLIEESDRLRALGRFGEAAVKLREASNNLHLANAESRRLAPEPDQV